MMPIRRKEPVLGTNPDYSRALYPDPASHDFCVWLIIAELMRRHHHAPAPLKVTFLLVNDQLGIVDFGPFGIKAEKVYPCNMPKAYSDFMMGNVMRPAMDMIGAIEEPSLHAPLTHECVEPYVEYDYHIGHLVDAGRQGYEIPRWTPPQWAHDEVEEFLNGRNPVIITLREMPHQPERNSQTEEWLKFARHIRNDFPVLFLRDTCVSDEPLDGFETWPRASRNIYVRAALYQRALVNMMVGNGPNIWCIFSDAPYLTFKQLVPELPQWAHGQPIGWKEQDHMDVGDQYPWASPLQRLAWKDDTFENIRDEFSAFLKVIEKKKDAA